MKLIHYGAARYNPLLFKSIKNSSAWFKPKVGGLWTSPINSKHSWKEWSDNNEFGDTSTSFTLEIITNKILVIDSLNDLIEAIKITEKRENVPNIRDIFPNEYLDYECIAKSYDAIHLTAKGEINTRFTTPNLYGFDCETVLILNKNIIKI